MKVFRTFLCDGRHDDEGLQSWTQTGELVEVGGEEFVECGGTLHRQVSEWHRTREASKAVHIPAMYRAAAQIIDQATRAKEASRAVTGDPAGGGPSAAGIAPPEVAR
jgi:hypothetical protein